MAKTKILLVDDHMVVLEGIKSALQKFPEFEVVGTASDGLVCTEMVRSLRPDIIVMDISMPNLNGIEATKVIKRIDPSVHVIIFTMYPNDDYIIDLFKADVSGFVMKDSPISDLILAFQAVISGGTYFSTKAPKTLRRHMAELEEDSGRDAFENLSQREREVLAFLADGCSVKEVAHRLCISPKTVESHKYNLMSKLNAQSAADLTKIAIRKKLINL